MGDDTSESDTDAYINEWRLRFRVSDQFFLSLGRENLQWGPSLLLSPSNPFNSGNNRQ